MADKLYVFGDSFSSPHVGVNPEHSFWGLAAKDLGVDAIYNFSFSGNCFDNIVHLILNDKFDFDNGYFLIGIPPLHRYSIFSQITPTKNKPLAKFNQKFEQEVIYSTNMINVGAATFTEAFTNDKLYVSYFRAEWNDVINLEKIYLLSNWLKTKNAKFIIANLSQPIPYQENWPAGCEIMKKVKADITCIVFADTYQSLNLADKIKPADYDAYEWYGHHGSEGNHNWYNKIIQPKMQQLKWI
jgi:hypothetical protein